MIWRQEFADRKGRPLSGLRVTVVDKYPISHPQLHTPWRELITDANGYVEMDLDPGDYLITAGGRTESLHIGTLGETA